MPLEGKVLAGLSYPMDFKILGAAEASGGTFSWGWAGSRCRAARGGQRSDRCRNLGSVAVQVNAFPVGLTRRRMWSDRRRCGQRRQGRDREVQTAPSSTRFQNW